MDELICFTTGNPYDLVARALDILRTMGFSLLSLSVEGEDCETYRVNIHFRPAGPLSSDTLRLRMARIDGLELLPSTAWQNRTLPERTARLCNTN
ncbi:hypothetical protein [Rhizobium alvei]|uniref:Uncharacterized protein n=1 Tax=Rhizobium alvei TaxID=1132659 RepID=A0ABT8YT24_9HYPH|nr:hypothetical protein [Rhizobium alvei]MDO6966502.1 hypothetical protein [Rhizobium alvei]